ncbi:thiamine phosphate synthase [Galbibacter mesophilus]|uniref:thiamine phosphate synthase n=1 Tax=Galbibacter mesophilus TaxID=379069 RepID=UPI00191F4FDF|nr:thiamine phosphate synthase [Galbibacter mesophilus]MCM5662064.1 thiamine phosphate synthase [Galbibacter mesophilus]
MNVSKLHYITQGATPEKHLENLEKVCANGGKWIQLRLKNETQKNMLETALEAKAICKRYGATLLINDHVEVAKEVNADGVHLGKEDLCPAVARKILGANKIIGGTANTWRDIENLTIKKVDYIGLGPFRFTKTKEKLSPILGLEGYKEIFEKYHSQSLQTPIIAIGGIKEEDLLSLSEIGLHGVAMSGWLTENEHLKERIAAIETAMNQEITKE